LSAKNKKVPAFAAYWKSSGVQISVLLPFCRFSSFFPAKNQESRAWQII
jgi:hypothetical protein